jgi:hypothetical protein
MKHNLTSKEFLELSKKPKKSKFNNKKTIVDGLKFDSLKESKRYTELKFLKDNKRIADLKMQVKFPIVVNGFKICTYIADFCYQDLTTFSQPKIVEDVKSEFTRKQPVYRLKKKLMIAVHNIEIKEV